MNATAPEPESPQHAAERALLDLLSARVEPVPLTAGYAVGIVVVSALLLILPLLYLSFIVGGGHLVYRHAVDHSGLLFAGGLWTPVFFYLVPLVGGATLVLFLLKPLFAGAATPPSLRTLARRDEPLLFAFVGRLCRAVDAPLPARIQVDAHLNASAGHLGFVTEEGRDLVLTIGLPLVAALSVRQFAGVLAHEFAHFRQGAGMRLSRFIWRVQERLAHLVFGRDAWDDALERLSETDPWPVRVVFLAARLFVALARLVVGLLMVIARALTCVLARHMERDADRYAVRLIGSQAFCETTVQLHLASAGLPPEAARAVERKIAAGRTGPFDSHPCDAERRAAARAAPAPGTFVAVGPATQLFRNFASLTEELHGISW